MTSAHTLAASIFAITLLAGLSTSPSATEAELLKGSIIRRHGREKTVHTTHKGEMTDIDVQKTKPKLHSELTRISYCNRAFTLAATTNPNECTHGVTIDDNGLCEEAAGRLGYTYNGTADDTWQNPLLMPKNCSVKNGIVHYNPTDPEPAQYLASYGVQLCLRKVYVDADGGSCPNSDYELVGTDWAGCHSAFNCIGTTCKMPTFADNKRTNYKVDRPQGCYKEPEGTYEHGSTNGCFNFNEQSPTATATGAAVCKLTAAALTTAGTGAGVPAAAGASR
jgi:hypothetical protein